MARWKSLQWSGPFLIYLLCALTIGVWFFIRIGTDTFNDYGTSMHSLGQLTALVGTVLFAITFILSIKSQILEEAFGGIDGMYKAHAFVGASAFVLLLFHPLLLVLKFVPSDMARAAQYLLPSSSWPVNFGIIALAMMTLLILLTLYIRMKYLSWKVSHKFMGLVFVVAMFHIFLVDTDIQYYPMLQWFMIVICAMGIIAFSWTTLIRPFVKTGLKYTISKISREGTVTILTLEPFGEHLQYRAGQFAHIRIFHPAVTSEWHPFTIASAPSEEVLTFAIKDLGDYTNELSKVTPGSLVFVDGPFGRFHPTTFDKKQIWIAGGIGVTPYLSLTRELLKNPNKQFVNSIDFFYSVKDEKELLFENSFSKAQSTIKNFEYIPWITPKDGYLTVDGIKKKGVDIANKDIFICGPPVMMKSLAKQLVDAGVSRRKIHMEEFGFK